MMKKKTGLLVIGLIIQFLLMGGVSCITVGSNSDESREANWTFVGSDNEILGFAWMDEGFTLTDFATQVCFDSVFPVSGDIALNGGTVTLKKDFKLENSTQIRSGGVFCGEGERAVHLPKNVGTFHLPEEEESEGPVDPCPTLGDFVKETNCNTNSLDWRSSSDYFVAASSVSKEELVLYQVVGSTINELASIEPVDGCDINTVRWHPTDDVVALAIDSGCGEQELWLYRIDINGPTYFPSNQQVELSEDVYAVSWSPNGRWLAVGRNNGSGDQVLVYEYNFGTQSIAQVDTISTPNSKDPCNNSISWSSDNQHFVVGTKSGSGDELLVYNFNGTTISLAASEEISRPVKAVSWSQAGPYIAIGIDQNSNSAEGFQIYRFDNGSTLTKIYGEDVTPSVRDRIFAVDWSHDGRQILVGGVHSGFPLIVYSFDLYTEAVTVKCPADNRGTDIFDLRWAPNDCAFLVGLHKSSSANCVELWTVPKEGDPGDCALTFKDTAVAFNSDVQVNKKICIKGTVYFCGDCHCLSFGQEGKIQVCEDAHLIIGSTDIRGLIGDKLCNLDDTGTITLMNSSLQLSGDTDFVNGSLCIEKDVSVTGPTHQFCFSSSQPLKIGDYSCFSFEKSVCFKYDPIYGQDNLLQFQDSTSKLLLDGAILKAGAGGLCLETGTLVAQNNVCLEASSDERDQGIMFKNSFSTCIQAAATLNFDGCIIVE